MSGNLRRINYLIKEIWYYLFSQNATYRKRLNILKFLLNWKIQKSIKVNNFPYLIVLGSGPICNLKCKLCPSGQDRSGRTPGFLRKDVVEKVIEELSHYVYSVALYNWGEPLLHKKLFGYIRLLKKAKFKVYFSTNLNFFNDEICKEMIRSGVDEIIISLHGCSQNALNQYQVGSNFERVISNVKTIIEYRKSIGVNHPKLQWRFIVNRFNENETQKAYKMSKKIGFDSFVLGPLICDMGEELLLSPKEQYISAEPFLPINEKWSQYSYAKKAKKHIRKNCYWLYGLSTINWDGSVSPCCAVWNEKFDFGNILETSFKEIWNGKKYQLARSVINSNKKNTIPGLICYICKKNNAILY